MEVAAAGSSPSASTPSGYAPEPAPSATEVADRVRHQTRSAGPDHRLAHRHAEQAQRPLPGAGYFSRTEGIIVTWPLPAPPAPPKIDPRLPPAAAALARQQLLADARAATITLRHPRLPIPLQRQIWFWGSRFCRARDSSYARDLWISNEQAAVRGRKRRPLHALGRLRITVHKLTTLCLWKHDQALRVFDPFDEIAVKHRFLVQHTHLSVQDSRNARASGRWTEAGIPGTQG